MTTAAPNTTPVSSVLGHEERITALEKDNHELRQALQSAIEAHNGLTLRVQGILRTHALISLAQNDRLRHLETVDRNDRRLQGYAERREAQRQADRSERAQIITRAACRMALQACWSQLDTIEVQLPAARSHVTTGIEERTAEQLHGLAFVGCELGRAS